MIDLALARTTLARYRRLTPAHGPDYHYAVGHLQRDYALALDEIEALRSRPVLLESEWPALEEVA